MKTNKNRTQRQRRVGRRSLRRAVAMIAIAPLLFFAGCSDAAKERAENVGGVTAKQIIENPAAYVGKTVTVSGSVDEIWGPRAFNMDSGLTVGELLVLGRDPFPQVPDAGSRGYLISDIATVTGVVRIFATADVEREIGWDLDSRVEVEYNAKPVLIAQAVGFRAGAGGQARVNTNDGQTLNRNTDPTETNSNSTRQTRLTDVGVYGSTTNKESLVGKDVEFSDIKVVRIVGPRTFTVASGDSEIYVMLNEESTRGVGTQGKIKIGSTLNLTGRFERLEQSEIGDIANARFRPLTDTERAFLKNTPIFLESSQVSGLK